MAGKVHCLGGSGCMPPMTSLNFRPSKLTPDAILGHNRPVATSVECQILIYRF